MSDHTNMRSAIPSIDVSRPELYRDDAWRPLFARLRAEDPVHYCEDSRFGPYWSISRYEDIYAIDADPGRFSSSYQRGGVTLDDNPNPTMITMDAPEHTAKRKAVTPVVAPKNLLRFEALIRDRVRSVLDNLPLDEEFNWVERVSIELTSMMLATLFGHDIEDRHRLVNWSDVIAADLDDPDTPIRTEEQRMVVVGEFHAMVNEAVARARLEEPRFDVVSLLAHSDVFADASPLEMTTTFSVLLVGGNDTTRNTMSGSIWGFSQSPEQFRLLRERPNLVGNAVAEMIRFQTPVITMRRTATEDIELHGRKIREGEKVMMWYISGNRDESVFEDPDRLRVDRENARQHIAFGMGPHRCLGSRLAELQLRILWEEIVARDVAFDVLAPPTYAYSAFVRTITAMPVRMRRN